ncbi:hypothetical protein TNIN_343391 [Trichonephila inaurata madagascariensis]|uniref:Uncharacterized protein n=1 Tax=Trichonephila inaurata madagascariensis TaxID=2747483 RepID=A0A8X7BZ49_9ARAC|nr:hypothetical protein TNIN_343391 [Trichonephila inaurata madagascariensis]
MTATHPPEKEKKGGNSTKHEVKERERGEEWDRERRKKKGGKEKEKGREKTEKKERKTIPGPMTTLAQNRSTFLVTPLPFYGRQLVRDIFLRKWLRHAWGRGVDRVCVSIITVR